MLNNFLKKIIKYLINPRLIKSRYLCIVSKRKNSDSYREFKKFYSNKNLCFGLRDYSNLATVIIPVYNGFEHLNRLLSSLTKFTSAQTKIIIINDCSTDSRISAILKNIKKNSNFFIMDNDNNLGFVKTINKAMKYVKTDYAIWLNSDTVVDENWINKLLLPFFKYKKVASVTPFTNSGTLFSFPSFGKNNDLVASIRLINRAFEHIKDIDEKRNSTPTGVGFCMGINMAAWNKIGTLDEEKFGKGYGEENDWCYRALKKGWSNKLSPNIFVAHYHGGSFGESEKSNLSKQHQKVLDSLYPEYTLHEVPKMFYDNKWKIYRQIALFNIALSVDKKMITLVTLSENKFKIMFDKKIDPLHENTLFISSKRGFNYFKKLLN